MKGYFGYIRVSTAKQGQTGSSLQEQRDAILTFAERHSLAITDWFEDRETAAKKGRTQFVRMMAALEKGKAAGVILHKIDRGARNLWDWARLQELIDAGVSVRFAHDDLDMKSRGGRLAADIQAVVAADYVRNLRDEVRKGIRGRLKQGLYPLPAPIGYLDQGKAKPKIIDPIKGPLVRAAFELYATGRYSFLTLPLKLQRMGLKRANGKPMSLCGIANMMRNPFYTGVIRVKTTGETFQGIHEPLIEPSLFRVVQAIIDGKSNTKARRNDFPYRRLLTCGECGYSLIGERQKGRTYYRCHSSTCKGTGMREDAVTACMNAAIKALCLSQEEIEDMRPIFHALDQDCARQQEELRQAARLRISALEARQERLTDAYLDQLIDQDTYNTRRQTLFLELAAEREGLRGLGGEREDSLSRAERFFEQVWKYELGPKQTPTDEYRDVVRELTSNRIVSGKNLYVTMRTPFKELGDDIVLLFGPPHQNAYRTFSDKTTVSEKAEAASTTELAARAIHERLKDWKPEPKQSIEEPRRLNPSWFKGRRPPPTEDRLAA